MLALFFFFNDTAPTKFYTLSLHAALPISRVMSAPAPAPVQTAAAAGPAQVQRHADEPEVPGTFVQREGEEEDEPVQDRKSTRLNSSHANISYAVFCLKKKKRT